jgi:hypothetical protein
MTGNAGLQPGRYSADAEKVTFCTPDIFDKNEELGQKNAQLTEVSLSNLRR